MKFHEHPLGFKELGVVLGVKKKTPKEEEIRLVKNHLRTLPKLASGNLIHQINAEIAWLENARPYYEVWPVVFEPFCKVDLTDLKFKDFKLPLSPLLLTFPVGHELIDKARSILVFETKTKRGPCLSLTIDDGGFEVIDRIRIHAQTVINLPSDPDITVVESISRASTQLFSDDIIDIAMVMASIKVAVAICLLGDNPDLIEPQPLEADRKNWESSRDPHLIQEAHKKGKKVWRVGHKIETPPGYRRPHFAIRWMGHGFSKTPTLRPISGCLVKRSKLTDVPTGYLGTDLTDIGENP